MKISVIAIGKIADSNIGAAIERYVDRIGHYIPFEYRQLPDVRKTRGLSEERQKQLEGEMVLARIAAGDRLILLDERGKELTSRQFAGTINDALINLPGNLVYVIGGPYGFSRAMYDRANSMLALSRMTFPHEMARLFFIEQVYRACTILRGEPYHHD